MASISFCMTTRGALPRVQGLLSLVRPYVDEIVLALDATGNMEALEACAGLADRRFTFGYAAPPCRNIGWLQHQCSCDWILRFDDDEIPSGALLEALPELVADRRPTHYGLTRRWLHGDASTYISSPPWLPDYQLRLVRNVPGIWRFTGELHDGAIVLGERRLVDLPIYHADLLLLGLEDRRRKAERYERLRPDHLAEGVPVNAIYVPEDWKGVATEAVPDADRRAIAAVLEAPAAAPASGAGGPPGGGRPVEHATLDEINRFNTNRTVTDGAYRARVEYVRPVASIPAGVTREQEVLVENLGDERWPWGADAEPPIRLAYRWLRPDSGEVLAEGPRTPFTETVEAGQRSMVKLLVEAPAEPGTYVLEADVVHEHVRWFGSGARLEVRVEDPAPAEPEAGGLRGYLAQARAHGLGARHALGLYPRWAASLRPERTPLSDGRPWVPFAVEAMLARQLRPDMRVCEYGAGGSTLFLLERVGELVTIEWDDHRAAQVADAVRPARARGWSLQVAAPEENPSSRQLDPSDPGAYVSASPGFLGYSFRSYVQQIDSFDDDAFDVVIVSGRARPSCVAHALPKVRRGGMLLLDHAERSWYGPALRLASSQRWDREDIGGPGPYAPRFWDTAVLRRRA
ncbi:MAG: hypothetical protein QOH46_3977 [Solirubrobacteraceae bacterium]|nr:hypothetical protein [Solirubrobacteraceae bacterium]